MDELSAIRRGAYVGILSADKAAYLWNHLGLAASSDLLGPIDSHFYGKRVLDTILQQGHSARVIVSLVGFLEFAAVLKTEALTV
jgi:hypothetical protein